MNKMRGFSLIEVALVLLIIGLLLGGALRLQSTVKLQQQRAANAQILERVREALLAFLLQNARLPCADTDNDGWENNSDGKCESATPMPPANAPIADQKLKRKVVGGKLPYRQLGVGAVDAYNQPLLYVVSVNFADNAALYSDPSPLPMLGSFMGLNATGVCQAVSKRAANALKPTFSSCSQGGIRVLAETNGSLIYDDLPFMVVSTGSINQSSDEQENADKDRTFVLRDYSNDPDNHYDDSLMWISAPVLALHLQNAGLLP